MRSIAVVLVILFATAGGLQAADDTTIGKLPVYTPFKSDRDDPSRQGLLGYVVGVEVAWRSSAASLPALTLSATDEGGQWRWWLVRLDGDQVLRFGRLPPNAAGNAKADGRCAWLQQRNSQGVYAGQTAILFGTDMPGSRRQARSIVLEIQLPKSPLSVPFDFVPGSYFQEVWAAPTELTVNAPGLLQTGLSMVDRHDPRGRHYLEALIALYPRTSEATTGEPALLELDIRDALATSRRLSNEDSPRAAFDALDKVTARIDSLPATSDLRGEALADLAELRKRVKLHDLAAEVERGITDGQLAQARETLAELSRTDGNDPTVLADLDARITAAETRQAEELARQAEEQARQAALQAEADRGTLKGLKVCDASAMTSAAKMPADSSVYVEAMFHYAKCTEQGKGTEKDFDEAVRIYQWAADHGWKAAEARLTQMKERCRKDAIEAGLAFLPVKRLFNQMEYDWRYNTRPSQMEEVGRRLLEYAEDYLKPASKRFGDALHCGRTLGVTMEETYDDAFTFGYRELLN